MTADVLDEDQRLLLFGCGGSAIFHALAWPGYWIPHLLDSHLSRTIDREVIAFRSDWEHCFFAVEGNALRLRPNSFQPPPEPVKPVIISRHRLEVFAAEIPKPTRKAMDAVRRGGPVGGHLPYTHEQYQNALRRVLGIDRIPRGDAPADLLELLEAGS
jgi:hypothetical protein